MAARENTAEARAWIDRHLHPQSWSDDEAVIRCPLPDHQDAHASAGANACKRTWYCHGCARGGLFSDLAELLGVPEPFYASGNGLRTTRSPTTVKSDRAVYLYSSRTGAPLLQVVRYHDRAGRRRTAIRHRPDWHPETTPRRPPDADGWSWCHPDIGGGLLYCAKALWEAAAGEPVIVVEGEKDVDRLIGLGFVATCNLGGAGKWSDFHTERMPADRLIIVTGDTDKPGQAHAATIALALEQGYRGAGKAQSVRLVAPEQLGYGVSPDHGSDISDWLDADPARGGADVQALIDNAQPIAPEAAKAVVSNTQDREWSVIVNPRDTPLSECFDAAVAALDGVELRRNARSGHNEVRGLDTGEIADPNGWAPLTDDGLGQLFSAIEQVAGAKSAGMKSERGKPRSPPHPWRVAALMARRDLVSVHAWGQRCDPFREWLETLPEWDGTARIDALLLELFGEPDDSNQDVRLPGLAMQLLLGTAVHRAYHPGAKQDVIPVLVASFQGQGKSSFAACVLPQGYRQQWFGDGLNLAMNRREVAEVTAGKVIMEMPEMSGLRRAELATLKSWLTTVDDGQARGAYKRSTESKPRLWSGIATCDKEEALPYDPAGHRRWLATAIGKEIVMDMDARLGPNREQLWAEALRLYRDAPPSVPPELWSHVAKQNRRYETREPVNEERVDSLDAHKWAHGAGINDLMADVGIDSRDWMRTVRDFGAALRGAGWELKRVTEHGRQRRIWKPPTDSLW